MASSCRTVMGMEERSSLSRSTCCTSLRRETKWEESISDASADKRGAHRLLFSRVTSVHETDAHDLQNAMYRFIFSISISPTASFSFCLFI